MQLYQLDENDIQTKLDTLFKKNLYGVSVSSKFFIYLLLLFFFKKMHANTRHNCNVSIVDICVSVMFVQVAVALAQSHGCEQSVITDIYKRYGDHLYGKGDYDGGACSV